MSYLASGIAQIGLTKQTIYQCLRSRGLPANRALYGAKRMLYLKNIGIQDFEYIANSLSVRAMSEYAFRQVSRNFPTV